MKIKSIHLKNIRSYIDGRVEFPEGATLLSGDIGCGKSTILQSIEFALFGLKKGELEGSEILRHGCNTGHVHVSLEIDGHDITIERVLKRSGKSGTISHDSCRLVVDNRPEDLTPVELKSRILEMFGYSQELLKKNKPLFRFTVYTPQEEMKKILYDEEDRLDTLRNIFGVDKYGTIRNNARIFMTELRRMKSGAEGELREMELDISKKDSIEAQRTLVADQLVQQKSLLAGASTAAESKKSELESARRTFNEMHAHRNQLARKESELAAKSRRLEQAKAEVEEAENKAGYYRKQTEGLDTSMPLDDLKARLREMEAKRDSLLSSKAVMSDEMRKLQKIYSDGICTLCGQKVHSPGEFLAHIENIKSKTAESDSESRTLDAIIAEAKKSILSTEKAAQYIHLIADMEDRKSRLEKEIALTGSDISSLGTDIMFLRPRTDNFDELEAMLSQLESEFYDLQKRKNDIDKACTRLEQQLEDANRRIDEIKAKAARAGQSRMKIQRITDLINWFDPFTALMDEMEKRVMLTIQKEFDGYFQKWFSILMDDQMSVRIDERFAPVIEQNGYITEYENLSGGEKTSVALAYRLALNKVINDMIDTIKTRDIIILDEPTDGFSTDQLDKLRDVIKELALRQIIIVSHEPKIDSYVDNVIRIYKENHSSRIEI